MDAEHGVKHAAAALSMNPHGLIGAEGHGGLEQARADHPLPGASPQPQVTPAGGRALRAWLALPLCVGWLSSVLLLDGARGPLAGLWLLVSGWLVLALLARGQGVTARWQCVAVLVVAGLVELVFAVWLDAYQYRMGPVAPYVLPGHGVIFLAARAVACEPALARRARTLALGTAALGLPLAVIGLAGPRHDATGAALAVVFAWLAVRGRWPLLYAVTFWLSLGLEYLGVHTGAWVWATHDQVLGLITIGNPPSVPGGAYACVDAAGLALGRRLGRSARIRGLRASWR